MGNKKQYCQCISIIGAVLTTGLASAESESPLQCELHKNENLLSIVYNKSKYIMEIVCTVVVDNVQVNNVVLNRGRCAAPDAATQEDTAAREKFIEDVKSEAGNVLGELGLLLVNPNRTPQEESIAKSFLDPRGGYQFSDVFSIVVPASCNLIEYTIDLDDVSWTWNM